MIVRIHSRSLFSNFCVYISLFQIFLVQGTNLFCKMLELNQLPIVYQTIALPYELISLQKLIAVRSFITTNKNERRIIMILGCVGSDSNRQSSAYEADELPFLYPAMGAAGGFEPRIQVMNLVSYL